MGKHKTNINWDDLEHFLVAGCPVREIAGHVGCSEKTIYDRCLIDTGETYSTYSQKKRANGKALIRERQLSKALGLTDKGDNTLLIWLGKVRLGQSEIKKVEVKASLSDFDHWVDGQENKEQEDE